MNHSASFPKGIFVHELDNRFKGFSLLTPTHAHARVGLANCIDSIVCFEKTTLKSETYLKKSIESLVLFESVDGVGVNSSLASLRYLGGNGIGGSIGQAFTEQLTAERVLPSPTPSLSNESYTEKGSDAFTNLTKLRKEHG